VCLAIFGLAFVVLMSREDANMRDMSVLNQRSPRVVLEDFIVYRTAGPELVSTWSAQLAHFFEPGELELHGDVKGIRYTSRGDETISSESLTAWFDTPSLLAMAGEGKLKRAELKRFVEVAGAGNLLLTDFAEYLADTNVLQSDRAVTIEGPNRQFNGESGFRYEVTGDNLQLFGKITGVLTMDDQKK